MLEEHGSDAVRYWAASSRLGTDAAFDPQNPKTMKIGRRLAIKVLNAAKFVYSFPEPAATAAVTHPLDADMLAELAQVVRTATAAYDAYDHARALEVTEQFFWTFCDDYLELVKERAYNQTDVGQASAALALRIALETLLRLFAPVLAFAAEESWSWFHDDSVHLAEWPAPLGIEGDLTVLTTVSEALVSVRRAKTEAKASQKTPVARVTIAGPEASVAALRLAEGDLKAVGRIDEIQYTDAEALAVADIELAPVEV
jgi:valyl-tRNA synthetase